MPSLSECNNHTFKFKEKALRPWTFDEASNIFESSIEVECGNLDKELRRDAPYYSHVAFSSAPLVELKKNDIGQRKFLDSQKDNFRKLKMPNQSLPPKQAKLNPSYIKDPAPLVEPSRTYKQYAAYKNYAQYSTARPATANNPSMKSPEGFAAKLRLSTARPSSAPHVYTSDALVFDVAKESDDSNSDEKLEGTDESMLFPMQGPEILQIGPESDSTADISHETNHELLIDNVQALDNIQNLDSIIDPSEEKTFYELQQSPDQFTEKSNSPNSSSPVMKRQNTAMPRMSSAASFKPISASKRTGSNSPLLPSFGSSYIHKVRDEEEKLERELDNEEYDCKGDIMILKDEEQIFKSRPYTANIVPRPSTGVLVPRPATAPTAYERTFGRRKINASKSRDILMLTISGRQSLNFDSDASLNDDIANRRNILKENSAACSYDSTGSLISNSYRPEMNSSHANEKFRKALKDVNMSHARSKDEIGQWTMKAIATKVQLFPQGGTMKFTL